MSSGHLWVVRWPNLPVLNDCMNTFVARVAMYAGDAITGVTFRQSAWLSEAQIEITDIRRVEGGISIVFKEAAKRLEEGRVAPVIGGKTGDTPQLNKIIEGLKFSPSIKGQKKKLCDVTVDLCKEFMKMYEGIMIKSIINDWKVSVKNKIEIKLSEIEEGYLLPSLIRSVSLYEGGRFSGFRDIKSGRLSKGVLEVRSDSLWWMLSLAAAGASLVKVERAGRETTFVFTHIEPVYNVRYESFSMLRDFFACVEEFVDQVGLFVEDEELFRLSLLFYVYSAISNPLLLARFGIKLRGIRLSGRRFTEVYVTGIYSSEVTTLHRVLQEYVGETSREVAEACADLGCFIMRMQRKEPEISRRLGLDAFAAKLKILMRALSEPGYLSTSEPLYELLRMMRMNEWRDNLIRRLAASFEDMYYVPREIAQEKAIQSYELTGELIPKVARLPSGEKPCAR